MNDVLFVCVHNAGRSQMAEALFNRMAAERRLSLTAESAETEPAGSVHENVAEAMREIGIDLPQARPELIGDAIVEQAGRVITMGCAVDAEACPAVTLRNVEDWVIRDPAGRTVEEVRVIRDEIGKRVERLIELLTNPASSGTPPDSSSPRGRGSSERRNRV